MNKGEGYILLHTKTSKELMLAVFSHEVVVILVKEMFNPNIIVLHVHGR